MPSVPDPANVKPWYLRNITEALALDEASGNVYIRTGITGDIIIEGNVNIPGEIDSHITSVGSSGNLEANGIAYLPIGGNVVVNSGNITFTNTSIEVTQGTDPWMIDGNINVTGGNVDIADFPDVSVTAFEEPLAVGITPVMQGSVVYGIDPDFWVKTELRGGNVTTTTNNAFQVQSGTSAGGYARLATTSYVTYQPGQGLMFRWTAAFTTLSDINQNTKNATGITSIVQNTGPIDREDGFSIGYSGVAGTKIGILHRRAGYTEIRQLIITSYATGNQTATVTLNGTAFTISLTAAASTAYTAAEIAHQLNQNTTVHNLWDITACNDIITFSYYAPGSQSGTYSFSSSGAGTLAAGTFSQIQAGASPTDTWTYIDSWNGTVPTSFDPTKLNVYGMDMRWLGSGRVRFFMEDPNTGKLVKIHTIVWTKNSTGLYPHVRNPSLRIIYRSGTTNTAVTPSQNVIVSGASVFGAIQGEIVQSGISQGYYHIDSTARSKDVIHHLLSIQNPYIRNGLVNKSSLIIQDLTMSAQGSDPSVIFIIKNPVGTSDLLVFNPLPSATAFNFAQYSTSNVTETLSLDNPSNIKTLGINSSAAFDLKEYNLTLNPGDVISIFFTSSSPISRTAIGMTWRVD